MENQHNQLIVKHLVDHQMLIIFSSWRPLIILVIYLMNVWWLTS